MQSDTCTCPRRFSCVTAEEKTPRNGREQKGAADIFCRSSCVVFLSVTKAFVSVLLGRSEPSDTVSLSLSVSLSVCLSLSLSVCLSLSLCLSLSVCMSACLLLCCRSALPQQPPACPCRPFVRRSASDGLLFTVEPEVHSALSKYWRGGGGERGVFCCLFEPKVVNVRHKDRKNPHLMTKEASFHSRCC